MTTERDPQTDPMPGDLLEFEDVATGRKVMIRVVDVSHGYVIFRPNSSKHTSDLDLPGWQAFAANAVVVTLGDG